MPGISLSLVRRKVARHRCVSHYARVTNQTATKPFAGYADFADCVDKNSDKDNPEAYCATIMRDEGMMKEEKQESFTSTITVKQGMAAFYLDSVMAEALSIVPSMDLTGQGIETAPPDEMHITLAYFPAIQDEDHDELIQQVAMAAMSCQPVQTVIEGVAQFLPSDSSKGKTPYVALVDPTSLYPLHSKLADCCEAATEVADNHGYIPHVTMAYVPAGVHLGVELPPAMPLMFDTLTLKIGNERYDFPLSMGMSSESSMGMSYMTIAEKYSEDQPRDELGRWGEGGGGSSGGGGRGSSAATPAQQRENERHASELKKEGIQEARNLEKLGRLAVGGDASPRQLDDLEAVQSNLRDLADSHPDASTRTQMNKLITRIPQTTNDRERMDQQRELAGHIRDMPTRAFNDASHQSKSSVREKVAGTSETVDRTQRPAPVASHTAGLDMTTAVITEKAVWTTAYVNDLPDSAFLYVQPGGKKDDTGKTEPRSFRHFPYRDASGAVDLPHLRNAISRLPQSNAPGLTPAKVQSLQDRGRALLAGQEKTKAGRRLAGSMRDRLANLAEAIKEVLSWADYEDKDEEKQKDLSVEDATFFVFKDASGVDRWVSFSSNGFKDREKEIVSTAALEEAVEFADKIDGHGPIRLWHTPGSDFGDCDFQGIEGRFLIESGTFHDTEIGQRVKEFVSKTKEKLGISIGFAYPESAFDGSVYKQIRFIERSVCPHDVVANPWTSFQALKGEEQMNSTKASWMETVLGSDLSQRVLKTAEQATKDLEHQVAFKTDEEAEKATSANAIATAMEAMKSAIGSINSPEVKTAWAALTKALAAETKAATETKEVDDPSSESEGSASLPDASKLIEALQEILVPMATALTQTQTSIASMDDRMKSLEAQKAVADSAAAAKAIADAAAEAEKAAEKANNRPRGADVYRGSSASDNVLDTEKLKGLLGETETPVNPVAPYIEDLMKGGIQ